jgi:UDP-2,4-diacetamido-2,4,6-trideoxy-beta-L-altropyranose hydrolase
MRVLFRFDANARIGAGHASRCLTLANALRDSGATCTLLTNPGAAEAFPPLRDCGHEHLERAGADDAADVGALPGGPFDWAVLDHYERGPMLEAALAKIAGHFAVIDDLRRAHPSARLLVDQTLGRLPSDYAEKIAPEGVALTGVGYAMIHPAFAEAGLRPRAQSGGQQRIVVCFGGSDPHNATGLVLRGILHWTDARSGPPPLVDVVLGNAAPHREAVAGMIAGLRTAARLHRSLPPGPLAALYAAADLAIGAAGISTWERCLCGCPSLLVVTGADQESNAAAIARAGAARLLGRLNSLDPSAVAAALAQFDNEPDTLAALGDAARRVCDGDGAGRIAAAMHAISERGKDAIWLRRAEATDSELLFAWQSDPETRRHFTVPQAPARAEHESWMARSLALPTRSLNIAVDSGQTPMGVLRLDRVSEVETEVSLLSAPGRYGRGIGSAMLRAARRMRPRTTLTATVLPQNERSLALFRKAGYCAIGADRYRQSPPRHPTAPEMQDHGT